MIARSYRRRRWLDRNAGLLIAFVLVPSLLGAMIFIRVPPPEDKEPIPIKVLYELEPTPEDPLKPKDEPEPAEPEPEPEPEAAAPMLNPMEMAIAATRQNSQEKGDQIVDPVPGDPDGGSMNGEEAGMDDEPSQDGTEPSGPVSLQDWVPTTDQAAELQAIGGEVAGTGRALAVRHQKLRDSIIRAEVVSAAKDFEVNTDGGMEGAIRTLNVDGFPDEIINEVFKRYDITYERRQIKATPGRNFLNAASTKSGTYRNVAKEGYFNVMMLSPKAMAFLVKLEVQALNDKGFEPRNTRVRKVIFGIVKDKNNRFDLGVLDIETERIR